MRREETPATPSWISHLRVALRNHPRFQVFEASSPSDWGRPNSDTGGEFSWSIRNPRDRLRWRSHPTQTPARRLSREFATSVNTRVTSRNGGPTIIGTESRVKLLTLD